MLTWVLVGLFTFNAQAQDSDPPTVTKTNTGWSIVFCRDGLKASIKETTAFITKEKICERKKCRPDKWIAPGFQSTCTLITRCELANCQAQPFKLAKDKSCEFNYVYDSTTRMCRFVHKQNMDELLDRAQRFEVK